MIKIKEMLCIKVSTCSDGVMCGRAATSFSLSRLFQLVVYKMSGMVKNILEVFSCLVLNPKIFSLYSYRGGMNTETRNI